MEKSAENKSRVELAVEQIIQVILDRDMKAGDKLPNEHELARELGIGRSTLREAIKRLVTRNILMTRQGAGTFVSDKNGVPEDPLGITFIAEAGDTKLALELSELRILVEPYVAALAARYATPADVERMTELCYEIQNAVESGDDYIRQDTQLHLYIAKCCGNSVLQNLVGIIGDAARVSIAMTKDKHRNAAFTEHWAIVRAIAAHDEDGAKYSMISHLNTARNDFVQMQHIEK